MATKRKSAAAEAPGQDRAAPQAVEARDLALPEASWPEAPERAPALGGPPGPTPRTVEILVGLEEIARLFAVSLRRVRTWEKMGAPVYRDSSGVARAERLELWEWFKANCAGA